MKLTWILTVFFLFSKCFAASAEDIVAATIIKEAGGEGRQGMYAVACVIQNRTNKNAAAICLQKYQFSCWNAATVSKKISVDSIVKSARKHSNWAYAKTLAAQILRKKLVDITGKATHYHTTACDPSWNKRLRLTKQIKNHLFYRV